MLEKLFTKKILQIPSVKISLKIQFLTDAFLNKEGKQMNIRFAENLN